MEKKKKVPEKSVRFVGTIMYIYLALVALGFLINAIAMTWHVSLDTYHFIANDEAAQSYREYFNQTDKDDLNLLGLENIQPNNITELYTVYIASTIFFWLMFYIFYNIQLFIYKFVYKKKINKDKVRNIFNQIVVASVVALIMEVVVELITPFSISENTIGPLALLFILLFIKYLFVSESITLNKGIFE